MSTQTSPNGRPIPVEQLLPHAQALAGQLGEVPSQNRLRTEFRVGSGKAKQLRRALVDLQAANGVPVPAEPATVTERDDVAAVLPQPSRVASTAAARRPGSQVTAKIPAKETTAPVGYAAQSVRVRRRHRVTIRTRRAHPPTPGRPMFVGGLDVVPVAPAKPAADTRAAGRSPRSWPVLLLALPAFVAIWSGWVGLGELAGFGIVHPLPGILDRFQLNTAITLPVGVETYAAYALHVWLSAGATSAKARRFAKWSAIGSLLLGMAGQGAYHLMTAAAMSKAPWPVVTLVACLPVAVLGMGAALAHLIRDDH